MIVIVVTGGRDFADRGLLRRTLDRLHHEQGVAMVAHGDARGADKLADEWAKDRGVVRYVCPASWGLHGRKAGPIRNRQMLESAKPDLVVAFPGGKGTADCCRQAEAMGFIVEKIGIES